ncbi:latrophilin-like protein LAT-2 [Ptychodera flava]|uniref:latrophilin-like protein LAT-2 n=1 Tax=Ptychodera flava TaxID=63121 RepID=UPI003969D80C
MRRYCDEHGAWAETDTTYCVGEEMSELQKSLNESTLNDTAKSTDVLEQLSDTLQRGETLTGGDVLLARDILATIARNKYFNRDGSIIHELLPLIKQFLLACSNSLDLRVEEQWGQTYRNIGSDGSAVSILSAMEDFGATVYLYMVQTGKDLFLQSKNIDLLGYFVNRGSGLAKKRKKRTLASNDTVSTHESVTFSRQFLDQFQATETDSDLPVALVMSVYRTTGNMLPADIKQTPAKRAWVKSVTTTRIVKKVNTVALAVSAHPKLENALYNLTDMAVIRLYEIQEGYNPRCSFADMGQHTGIWDVSVCRLLRQGFDKFGEYVECVCDQVGTFCAIMSLGEQPKPFLESANKPFMAVYSGISALLILTALFMISFSRLPSDRYFVLGQAILSLSSFPIIICTASALESMDSEQPNVCQVLAVAMNYSLFSSCCWIMNMSIQQLRRLMFIDRVILARILYVLNGWLLPLVAVVSLYVNRLPDYENIVSCWLDASTYALSISIAVEVLIMMITLVIICYAYYIFTKYGQKCGQDESERLWEDVFSVMLLYGTILFVRVTGYSTTLAKSLDSSYFFTLMIFFEVSKRLNLN